MSNKSLKIGTRIPKRFKGGKKTEKFRNEKSFWGGSRKTGMRSKKENIWKKRRDALHQPNR